MKRTLYLSALAVLSTTIATCNSYAINTKDNDALVAPETKISLSQAVTTAEQHITGKASRAELENHKGQWVFDVEVINGQKVVDVKVDPESGKVLAATEDKADRDDEQDKED
jgi:uncharacterized membrane protein YkoI